MDTRRKTIDSPDRESLVALYESGLSLYSIGDHFGVSDSTVLKWMKQHNIPRRPRAEATRAANRRRPTGHGSRGGSPRALSVHKTRQKRIEIVREYRNSKGCERCGEKHPAVLDLHHRDPDDKHGSLRSYRTGNGHKRVGRGWREVALRDLRAELEKCEVLCSNCHRKLEWEAKQAAAS